jgi:hypothetical protein
MSGQSPNPVVHHSEYRRGAAGWGGPDSDAFIGYVMWDDQNLYIAADVHSPTYRQTETGPSVWKGDTLWIYLNPRRDRSTVGVKLTLAQTPQGPQGGMEDQQPFARGKPGLEQGDGFHPMRSGSFLEVACADQAQMEPRWA